MYRAILSYIAEWTLARLRAMEQAKFNQTDLQVMIDGWE